MTVGGGVEAVTLWREQSLAGTFRRMQGFEELEQPGIALSG